LVDAEGPVANMFTGTDSVTTATATSGAVTVAPGSIDHFVFTTQPDPVEKVFTNITISVDALDIFDNISNFNGAANISDYTGTIYEAPPSGTGAGDTTINFVAGQYSGDVVIQSAIVNDVISVSFGIVTGISAAFDVIENNVIVRLYNDIAPKVAFAGDRIAMFEIEMENPDTITFQNIELTSIEFAIENSKDGQAVMAVPADLISSIEIMDITTFDPGPTVGLETAPNTTLQPIPVDVSGPPPVTITAPPGPPLPIIRLRVYVTLKTDLSQADVANIQLRVADVFGTYVPSLAPVDPTNDSYESIKLPENYIRSSLTNIREEGADAAYNYPNPFNPRKQTTNIVYYSSSSGQTTIKIFTITGRLVRTLTDAATPDSNEVTWDGKNGRGQIVRNGVYVAVILPPGGSKQMVKIAVVK